MKFIVSPPLSSTNFCAICGSFLIRIDDFAQTSRVGGLVSLALSDSQRIRLASPHELWVRMIFGELPALNRFARVATGNHFGRLTSEPCSPNSCWERNPTADTWIFSPC